jgi:hypothetical protein
MEEKTVPRLTRPGCLDAPEMQAAPARFFLPLPPARLTFTKKALSFKE